MLIVKLLLMLFQLLFPMSTKKTWTSFVYAFRGIAKHHATIYDLAHADRRQHPGLYS